MSAGSRAGKLFLLSTLYFVEGLPWGFQSKALPVFLRTQDVPLSWIGLLNALSLPWMMKVLWSPLVDRYGSERFGRRKSWIIPLQIALATTCLVAAACSRASNLSGVLVTVFLMNLFAATMDIAVDGLAVDLLGEEELGTGNIAQVVGYKFGALTSGGLLVWATAHLGWPGLFVVMAGVIGATAAFVFVYPEPRGVHAEAERAGKAALPIREIVAMLYRAAARPGALVLFLFVATYKTGEQLIDAMFKPFLIDRHYSASQVGLWVSTYGMLASLSGSFLGGILAARVSIMKAMVVSSFLRAIPVGLVFALTFMPLTPALIIGVAAAENFFGGMLTTTVFAFMMVHTDRRIGASHYTMLSTIEMLGKAPVPMVAGFIAQHHGYSVLFGAGTVLSALFLVLLPPLRRLPATTRAELPTRAPTVPVPTPSKP